MADFREEMEAQARLHTSSASPALCGIALCDEGFYQSADLAFLVEAVIESGPRGTWNANDTYRISRCLPVSITQVISGMVIPVSAIFVAAAGGQ